MRPLLRSPAAWVYAGVWLAAAAYLAAAGHGNAVLNAAIYAAGVLLFCLFTVALTETPPPPEAAVAPTTRTRLALQVAATLFFVVITGSPPWPFMALSLTSRLTFPSGHRSSIGLLTSAPAIWT